MEGETLDQVVDAITSDKRVWVDTMMAEELKLSEISARPERAALFTFVAFALCGVVPLLPFITGVGLFERMFAISIALAAATFFPLGIGKGMVLCFAAPLRPADAADRQRRGWLGYAMGVGLRTLFGISPA